MDKKDRRVAIEAFKRDLIRQRRAWVEYGIRFERAIAKNPDVSKEKMMEIVRRGTGHPGLDEREIAFAERMIDAYQEARRRLLSVNEMHPDDVDLIKELTGVAFPRSASDEFEITIDPLSFRIVTSAENIKKMYPDGDEVFHEGIEAFAGSKRVHTQEFTLRKDPIRYIVVDRANRKRHIDTRRSEMPAVLRHEKQHVLDLFLEEHLSTERAMRRETQETLGHGIKDFFIERILAYFDGEKPDLLEKLFSTFEKETDPIKKEALLEEYFVLQRDSAYQSVAMEIFAWMEERSVALSTWLEERVLLSSFQRSQSGEDPAYDFLRDVRDRQEMKDDPLWQKLSKQILVDEYAFVLRRAVRACESLRESVGVRKTIWQLEGVPIEQWPLFVKRELEGTEK